MRRHILRAGLVPLAILLGACSSVPSPARPSAPGPVSEPTDGSSAAAASASTRPSSPAPSTAPSARIDGAFDVGAYSLALECSGSGSPTVVYVHGLGGSRDYFRQIGRRLADRVRVCAYDRVNTGDSDTVDGRHTAADSARDLERLLAAAGVAGPHVLVGASFGGLVSLVHAATHPDDVAGLVLLDATLPGYGDLMDLIPSAERREIRAAIDANAEGVDAFASLEEAAGLLERLPDIPVTYLAATVPLWPTSLPVEDMTRLATRLQEELVGRFTHGRLVTLDAPHVMEPVVPDEIATEIERVLDVLR